MKNDNMDIGVPIILTACLLGLMYLMIPSIILGLFAQVSEGRVSSLSKEFIHIEYKDAESINTISMRRKNFRNFDIGENQSLEVHHIAKFNLVMVPKLHGTSLAPFQIICILVSLYAVIDAWRRYYHQSRKSAANKRTTSAEL